MTHTFFPAIKQWQIPESALAQSRVEMARDGLFGNEGIVMWLGRRSDGRATVSHLVGLRGPEVIKAPDQIVIAPPLFNDLTDLTIELGVSLLGHIHSHGPLYLPDLSPSDRLFGVNTPYYLSIVAPDYAQRRVLRLEDCSVNVFLPERGFVRLSRTELKTCVAITSGGDDVPFLVVGEVP